VAMITKIMTKYCSREAANTMISKYSRSSILPNKKIRQVGTLVLVRSFILLSYTTTSMHTPIIKKGKGIGVPGTGIHAVFFLLIS